jgi:proline iminopeptidase
MRRLAFGAVLLLTACIAPRERANPKLAAGEQRLAVPGGRIWYKISNDSAHGIPVVLLHGGPGMNSFYLKPLEALRGDRPVIRYDQLGSGHSDSLSDTTMMNIGHFVAELDSLRSSLGVEKWHVYGHSWGSMLALEYYRAHPDRVASLTLAGPVFDVPAVVAHVRTLIPTLSDSAQRAIRRGEAAKKYDDRSYQNASMEFMGKYLVLRPRQPDWDSTFATFNQTIYNYMQGPSEFTITGTFKDWSAMELLPTIKVPVLVTVGEVDEVGQEPARMGASRIPGARFEIIPNSAHLAQWDNPDRTLQLERDFLRGVDSAAGTSGGR